MAKDPVPMAGENREAPKVVLLPVTEETPQFKDFHIRNVVCNGAEKAIFIRGLPEMNIKDIHFENIVIQSKKGVEITEAANVTIKNMSLLSTDNSPLISIGNSSDISFSTFKPLNDFKTLFKISGEKTAGISLLNSAIPFALEKTTFDFGATNQSLSIK